MKSHTAELHQTPVSKELKGLKVSVETSVPSLYHVWMFCGWWMHLSRSFHVRGTAGPFFPTFTSRASLPFNSRGTEQDLEKNKIAKSYILCQKMLPPKARFWLQPSCQFLSEKALRTEIFYASYARQKTGAAMTVPQSWGNNSELIIYLLNIAPFLSFWTVVKKHLPFCCKRQWHTGSLKVSKRP